MRDTGTHRLERVRGRAEVTLSRRAGAVRLDVLGQQGSAKAFLPRVHGPVPEVVFLNTAGGLTGGDRLSYRLAAGAGAAVTGTTQTAERIYSSTGDLAEVEVRLVAAEGARLHWLPQETILFDKARLSRHTRADLSGDAELLLAETLVLGRAAMGEAVQHLDLLDRREVWRDGRPVFLEPLRLGDHSMGSAALIGSHRAMATLALLARGAEDAVGPLRAALGASGDVEIGVSGWDGRCLIRLAAERAAVLRQALRVAMEILRGAPLPRVWQL